MIVFKPLVLCAGLLLAGAGFAQACPDTQASAAGPSGIEQAQSDNLPRPMATSPHSRVLRQSVDVTTATPDRDAEDTLSTGSVGRR